MVQSLQIENLRGIVAGRLEAFAPLTILTGPNGCGKSTVLDALLIGSARKPITGIVRAVARRPRLLDGARWLVGKPEQAATIEVQSGTEDEPVPWELTWRRVGAEEIPKDLRAAEPPYSLIELRVREQPIIEADEVYFAGNGQSVLTNKIRFESRGLDPYLIDPGLPRALDDLFSDAVRQGRRREVQDFLRELAPTLETLEILKEKDRGSQLYLVTAEGAVPVAVSGDGIQSFAQLAIELAAIPEGLALIEEPEVYQHPRAIWQSAKALLAAVARGVQVVLSTHSLELIDALIGQASEAERENLALYNLALVGGELRSSRSAGEEMLFARRTLEHDLR